MIFEMKNISKSFPGVKALDDVSLSLKKGEVRALVGENGAGKSTLIKILNGNYQKDSGQIFLEGKEVDITTPMIAAELGISIIFQELNLVDGLSIAENIFAGRLSEKGKLINWKKIYTNAQKMLDTIGFDIDPRTEVGKLSIAGKQMVEIAKALSYDAKVILMDEPSATLTQNELEKLFDIIRDLKKRDVSVVYISHRLEEVFEICDSASILRDGQMIQTEQVENLTQDQIVEMMVGREINQTYPERKHEIGEEVLRVENMKQRFRDTNASFSLNKGEVLGIAGLVGSGRTELMRALFGVDYTNGGKVYVDGEEVRINSPEDAKKVGIAFVTEDRRAEGLTIEYSVKSNISMTNLKKMTTSGFLSTQKENDIADGYIDMLNIRTPSRDQKVLFLSGGNQQKVVLAKWMNADPNIIIMDEPTRGIDVGSKLEIYEFINDLASQGKSIILISSELPEVLGMSDRVLVMNKDVLVAELTDKEDINAVEVMKYAL